MKYIVCYRDSHVNELWMLDLQSLKDYYLNDRQLKPRPLDKHYFVEDWKRLFMSNPIFFEMEFNHFPCFNDIMNWLRENATEIFL